MKKLTWIIVAVVVVLGGGYLWYVNLGPAGLTPGSEQKVSAELAAMNEGKSVVTPGAYAIIPAESLFNWSAGKPLIDGYINSGTIDFSGGSITVGTDNASGMFTLDMNTLHVGLTAKKPGKEGALEKHLKTDDFFDVGKYPTATFAIKSVEPNSESNATFMYRVTGDLTMKGVTNELSFPASIYLKDGKLVAEAETEIDRTKWGITYGSGNFFQNLGDNLIDDMVAVSFSVTASPE